MPSKGISTRLRRFSTWAFAAAGAAGVAAALTFSTGAAAQTAQGRIAFERGGSVWTMNADGTAQTELAQYYIGHEPSLSADGQRIVFTCGADGPTDVCAVDAAGGAVTMLTATGDNRSPAFSPDGQKVAFVSRRDGSSGVYVMDADGSNVVQLATGDAGGDEEEYPTWSPDGQRVAFVRNSSEVYTAKADGSGDVQLVAGGAGFKVNLAYSPDGSHIAFDDINDVYVVSAAGGGAPVRLTTTGTQSYDPAWSPDGQRIAFHRTNVVRDEYGNHLYTERGLYVMQANGLGLASLNCPDGYSPSWANVSAAPTPTPTPEPTPTPTPEPTPTPTPEPTPTPTPGPSASERVANLINVVNGFNLHQGIANSLLVKLNHAQGALAAGDTAAACDNLASFINQVNAQSGKKLTAAQASQLTGEAALIRAAIGCQ
jgi:dipeptidyl aminopeptidase/acylaminoacyl peptidase